VHIQLDEVPGPRRQPYTSNRANH